MPFDASEKGPRNQSRVTSSALHLWTIQREATWRLWQRAGNLSSSWQYVPAEWRVAYRWMAAALARKSEPPSQSAAPVWAWFQSHGAARNKPDLRWAGHLETGTRGVRVELVLSESSVLLSDFELWHYVLNNWALQDGSGSRRRNWRHIFDLDFALEDVARRRSEKAIQAVFWTASMSAVVRVDSFVAR